MDEHPQPTLKAATTLDYATPSHAPTRLGVLVAVVAINLAVCFASLCIFALVFHNSASASGALAAAMAVVALAAMGLGSGWLLLRPTRP